MSAPFDPTRVWIADWLAVDDAVRPLSDVSVTTAESPFAQLVAARLGQPALPPAEPPAALGLVASGKTAGAGLRYWTPDGALLLRLIEQWLRTIASERFGGMELVSPTLYRWRTGEALHDLAVEFEDRLFVSRTGERAHVLRYSADPGFFDYLSSLSIRPADLPLRLWEYGTLFRRNRAGELRGIQRLHEFHLLDHHTVCRPDEAADEYLRLLGVQIEVMRSLAGQVAVEFTVTRDRFDRYLPVIRRAAAMCCSPAVVKVLPQGRRYWRMKSFLHVAGPYETSNLQLDEENAQRFHLGSNAAVIHCTTCSVERIVLVVTAVAARLDHPVLPLWLSPVQVRVLPVRTDTQAGVETLALLRTAGIRAELDDRSRTLSWRVRDAAMAWVPYVVVVGERDHEADEIEVRHRDGRRERLAPPRLVYRLSKELGAYPRAPLPRTSTRERFWVT